MLRPGTCSVQGAPRFRWQKIKTHRQDTTGALLVLDQLRGCGSDSEIVFPKFLLSMIYFWKSVCPNHVRARNEFFLVTFLKCACIFMAEPCRHRPNLAIEFYLSALGQIHNEWWSKTCPKTPWTEQIISAFTRVPRHRRQSENKSLTKSEDFLYKLIFFNYFSIV